MQPRLTEKAFVSFIVHCFSTFRHVGTDRPQRSGNGGFNKNLFLNNEAWYPKRSWVVLTFRAKRATIMKSAFNC